MPKLQLPSLMKSAQAWCTLVLSFLFLLYLAGNVQDCGDPLLLFLLRSMAPLGVFLSFLSVAGMAVDIRERRQLKGFVPGLGCKLLSALYGAGLCLAALVILGFAGGFA
jgi:hypothetical protein